MLSDDIVKIRETWMYLRNDILRYPYLDREAREVIKNRLLEMQNDLKSLISRYKDDLVKIALLDEAQDLLKSISSLLSALRGIDYGSVPSKGLDSRISNVDNNIDKFFRLLAERIGEYKDTKKTEVNAKDSKKVHLKTKKEFRKEDIIRWILIPITIIFAVLAIYYLYLYNPIFFIISGLLAAIAYSIYKGSAAPFITWGFLIGLVGGVMYLWINTGFSRYIQLVTGYSWGNPISSGQNYLEQIKESISKVLNNLNEIMTNPEAYYIQQQAEAEPLQESYQYILEVNSPYSIPMVPYFPNGSNVTVPQSTPLSYFIKSSLPADAGVIGTTEYCIIVPRINPSCIDTENFGDPVPLDESGRSIGYIKLVENGTLTMYGLQTIFCSIPSFTLRLSNCSNLKYNGFYIDNKFILRLTNVTVTTYYKFLVTDVSLVLKAMENNENVYDYLNLNPDDYDHGYFKGFIGFPSLDVLRVGVLSGYPVIVFNKSEEIQDAIYISLSDIEEIYNISGIEVDILYNPDELSITANYNVSSYLYNLTCNNPESGVLRCIITFGYYPGVLGGNLYLSEYEQESNRIMWFIPINIEVKNGFREYADVLVIANATYGLQEEITNSVNYVPIQIQANT